MGSGLGIVSRGDVKGMTTYTEGERCHWCGNQYASREFYPACSQGHRDKLTNEVSDRSYNPSINREKEAEIKLWAKFINHQLAAWAAIFELITGNKPPKIKEILAVISGH